MNRRGGERATIDHAGHRAVGQQRHPDQRADLELAHAGSRRSAGRVAAPGARRGGGHPAGEAVAERERPDALGIGAE